MPIFNDDVAVNTAEGTQLIRLDVNKPTPGLLTPLTHERIRLDGNVPSIVLYPTNERQNTVRIDGGKADLTLGGAGQTGNVVLRNGEGDEVVTLNGARMVLRGAGGKKRISLDGPEGNLWLGGQGGNGNLMLFDGAQQENNSASNATIWLNGQTGDIVLRQCRLRRGVRCRACSRR